MKHPNKNRLLEYFYKEGSGPEIRKTGSHLHDCHECSEYLQTLKNTCGILDELEDEMPAENGFELIMKTVDAAPRRKIANRQEISIMPYFQIALSIPFILAVLYYFQNKLSLLPVWETLEKIWIIEKIGSFGVVAIIFFLAGSFITMALAPVLLDSEKINNHCQTCN